MSKKSSLKRIALVSLTSAVICVCSWITVPFTVPFTLQTFGVFLALFLLGARDGTAAIVVYLLLGAAGLPVFSGFSGGVGHLLGPTGGYLIGFLFSAAAYALLEKTVNRRGVIIKILSSALMLALCYLVGTMWFVTVTGMNGGAISFGSAFAVCVLPFIIPDAAKTALAFYIAKKLKRFI